MSRRAVACCVLAWYLAGCTSWHVEELTPQQVIDRSQPASLRVTTTDSAEFVLQQPAMSGPDTLSGLRHGAPARVPVSSVAHVAIRKADAGLTAGLVLVVVIAAAVAAVSALKSSLSFAGCGC